MFQIEPFIALCSVAFDGLFFAATVQRKQLHAEARRWLPGLANKGPDAAFGVASSSFRLRHRRKRRNTKKQVMKLDPQSASDARFTKN